MRTASRPYDITDYGASGNGNDPDTDAIQAAIDECHSDGGGTVVVPPGIYLTGTIELKSQVTLALEAGSTLRASLNPADYRAPVHDMDALIVADNARDIGITGRGVIDGRATSLFDMDEYIDFDADGYPDSRTIPYMDYDDGTDIDPIYDFEYRPDRLCLISGCENVIFRDATIHDSPIWTVHVLACRDVTFDNIDIRNHMLVPNNDGIVPDKSKNIRISDCTIYAADDNIVMKTTDIGESKQPCEDVVVDNCVLAGRSSALAIGTETTTPIRNCLFQNCIVRSSNRGIGIQLRDQGSVENIIFSDIFIETLLHTELWRGQAEPIHVSAMPREKGSNIGDVRGIRFSNVIADGEQGIVVQGSEESTVTDLVFDEVRLRITESRKVEDVGGMVDIRPTDVMDDFYPESLPGIFCAHVQDLSLRDVSIEWDPNSSETFAHGIECIGCDDVDVIRFAGASAPATSSVAMSFNGCAGITVLDSHVIEESGPLLSANDTTIRAIDGNNGSIVEAGIDARDENG